MYTLLRKIIPYGVGVICALMLSLDIFLLMLTSMGSLLGGGLWDALFGAGTTSSGFPYLKFVAVGGLSWMLGGIWMPHKYTTPDADTETMPEPKPLVPAATRVPKTPK